MTDPSPSFDPFKLSEPVLRALAEVGYAAPTPVQSATFELIASGRDVIVQSRTGSGKTAAFALPLLDRVIRPEARLQVMVLCPTRELALQVAGEFERLGKYRDAPVVAIYGGAPMDRQVQALRAGAKVMVGTPGRVLDHLRRGTLDPKGVRAVVLDEGDEMLSMGFAEELNAILEQIPKTRQGLIFSATMPDSMQRMAQRHLREPETLALSTDRIAPDELAHYVYFATEGSRIADLARILELERPGAALVFCNTKHETEQVSRGLQQRGLRAEFLNGDMAQSDRERVMGMLRDERVQYLVATDVAARGIDVPHLSHVINVGLPETPESYVHRTGRTGRAGRAGTAITLAGPHDIGNLYLLRLTYGIRPIERVLPSVGEERTRREMDRLQLLVAAFPQAPAEEAVAVAKRLLTLDDAERLVASLVGSFFDLDRRERVARSVARPEASSAGATAQAAPSAPAAPSARPAQRPDRPRREPRVEGRPDARVEGRPEPRAEARPEATADASAVAAPNDRPERARDRRAPEAERPRRVDVHHAPRQTLSDDEDGEDVGMEELRLAVGRREGVRAGEVARMLADTLKIPKRDIGRIQVRDRMTLVNLRAEHLPAAIEALKDMHFNDRPVAPERGRAAGPESEGEAAAAAPVAPAAAEASAAADE